MKTGVVIQARMGSTRLPGKSLADLGGRPLLARLLQRLRDAPVDVRVVATPEGEKDAPLRDLARAEGWEAFEGAEEDVLARYAACAEAFDLDLVFRVTGDNPFTDPEAIPLLLQAMSDAARPDYGATSGWPRGTGVEVVRSEALASAAAEAKERHEREHVMPFILSRPDRFRIVRIEAPPDRRSDASLTVDEEADLELARAVVARLGPDPPLPEILSLFEAEPGLSEVNRHVARKGWG